MEYGLYLHIPFCVRKCIYCDFYSIETLTGPIPKRLQSPLPNHTEFLQALEHELEALPSGFRPSTIFIGGGTPTELSDSDLQGLLDMLARHVDLTGVEEWTCESNPGTLTRAKAELLRAAGINRISMGVQSFHPPSLEFLGRIHGPDEVPASYALLRDVGFDNINLDLIYGVPGADQDVVAGDIQQIIALAPEHASCYCLTFEEDTPLMDMKLKGFVQEVDGDEERQQYDIIRRHLREAGYEQYEISNFARPSRACRHNLIYWTGCEYIGCGPSAHSHWQGRRYANVRHLRPYCKAWLAREPALAHEEQLEREAKARETLIMWLRLTRGVPLDTFASRTGFTIEDLGGETLRELLDLNMLTIQDNHLRVTEKGLFVSDRIFSELV